MVVWKSVDPWSRRLLLAATVAIVLGCLIGPIGIEHDIARLEEVLGRKLPDEDTDWIGLRWVAIGGFLCLAGLLLGIAAAIQQWRHQSRPGGPKE